jgi:hypothetical protein
MQHPGGGLTVVTLLEILRGVAVVIVLFAAGGLWLFVMHPSGRALSDEEKERAYQRRVEAAVAKRLDAERFEADVQRRLEAARSTDAAREEV